jgi:hypothetical protein
VEVSSSGAYEVGSEATGELFWRMAMFVLRLSYIDVVHGVYGAMLAEPEFMLVLSLDIVCLI